VPTLNNIALLYESDQKWDSALSYYQRSVRIVEDQMGKTHFDLVFMLSAMVWARLRRLPPT